MDNLQIYEAVRSVPDNAKKSIVGGRLKGKTDINPMWRIKMLTEQFGPCGFGWYYKTTRQWIEEKGEEAAAFVNIELYVKIGEEWSQPVFGTGGSMFLAREKGGSYLSDECYKMATTDAISVACKQLGIGADVYWEADRTKYPCSPANDVSAPDSTASSGSDISEAVKKRLEPVKAELIRIGYSSKSICSTYKLESIYDMSDLQIKDFLRKSKNLPDKKAVN